MNATFTKAVCYQVEAVCVTPLRTCGADGDTELVLRNWQGIPMIQGSSLAGAMRGWLEKTHGAVLANQLFGSQEQAGHLVISDAMFQKDTKMETRPRLRIDAATGSAAAGGKFDVAHISTGERFHFSLTWLGDEAAISEASAVEQMLSAMQNGEIRLGAQKSNGFGHVLLSVKKRVFDLQEEKDREAWLKDSADGAPIELPELKGGNEVIFTLFGHTDSVLVKGAAAEQADDGSYVRNLQEAGQPVIPGSSIKGVIRARASMIAKWKGLPDSAMDDIFGRESGKEDNGVAGRLRFEDCRMSSDETQKITRLRINRFTGGVIRQGLFREEPVCSKVSLRITAPADCPVGCGLLVYALRDLGLNLVNLGSGDAIGRGRISTDSIRIEIPNGKAASITFDEDRNCTVKDPSGLIAGWLRELEVRG